MNALCFADISLPILQAFFKFILILRIICSLKLFDNSTSPHSSTRFIAAHSIAYFNAFFNIWPHPAKFDFLKNVSSRSSILFMMSAVFLGFSPSTNRASPVKPLVAQYCSFLREGIILQRSRQDGVAGTVTIKPLLLCRSDDNLFETPKLHPKRLIRLLFSCDNSNLNKG